MAGNSAPGRWPAPVESGLSGVVGSEGSRVAVESDGSAVGDDPLWSGVAEGDSDTDDGVGVVTGDLGDEGVALGRSIPVAIDRGRDISLGTGGWSGDDDTRDLLEDAAFAEGADPSSDQSCWRNLFAGLEYQYASKEGVEWRETVGDRELVDDFETAAPGVAGDLSAWAGPDPCIRGLPLPEFD
jgi:hypothetical protein